MNIKQKLQYRNGVPVKLKLINKQTACLHVAKKYRYLSKYFRHRIVNCIKQKEHDGLDDISALKTFIYLK